MTARIDISVTEPQSLDGNPFGWTVTVDAFGGNCPVEATGTIGSRFSRYAWYFRARGSVWTLELGECLDEFGLIPWGEELFIAHGSYGPWPAAGWMNDEDAAQYITDALVAFSRGGGGMWEHPVPKRINQDGAGSM